MDLKIADVLRDVAGCPIMDLQIAAASRNGICNHEIQNEELLNCSFSFFVVLKICLRIV